MQIPKEAWIVVADGEKAIIYQNVGTPLDIKLTELDRMAIENPPTREQG